MVAFDGFLNCTLTTTDWPAARLLGEVTVMYGVPASVHVAFASVTSAVNPVNRIWNGPLTLPLPVFLIVTAPT